MNDNGTKPTGPIRPTAGQEAQGFRQLLASMLTGILEEKAQMNRQRLANGEPPVRVGIAISDQDTPLILATQAICAHLHHLTVKLDEVRQSGVGKASNFPQRLWDLGYRPREAVNHESTIRELKDEIAFLRKLVGEFPIGKDPA